MEVAVSSFDFDRPFIDAATLPLYRALDAETASRYGAFAKAIPMANFEYTARHARFSRTASMRPPPNSARKFPGFLVVRKIGRRDEYETWMPEAVFSDLYAPVKQSADAPARGPGEA